MKRYFNFTILVLSLIIIATSCKKDEKQVVFQGGTAPQLSGTSITDTVLLPANRTGNAFTLSWTNPNYSFNTGLSSQNVTYSVEFDTVGANFTNPSKQVVSVSNDLSKTFTVGEFNTVLAKLGVEALRPHNIELRVVSNINGTVPLTSNSFILNNVTPFEDFAVPAPGTSKLYITGSATPGGWQAGVAGEAVPTNQEFVAKSRSLYEIPSIFLTGGQSYLLLPQYGSWSVKYGGLKGNNENNPLEDEFKVGGNDLKAPPESGNYKIEVNFQTGKYKLTKL